MALPASIEILLRQSGRGVGQINARSQAKQAALAPYAGRAGENYAGAISSGEGVGRALQGGLVSQGQQLGGGIEAALTGIQAPGQAIATHAGGVTQAGVGAGGAIGALSSAELGRLRGFQSAEQIYASALPRLAALAGEQERRGFLAQAQADLEELSLREAEQAAENARLDREWAYNVRQDRLDRKRQAMLDRRERSRYRSETRYERRKDAREYKRDLKLDDLAARAAEAELGLKVVDDVRADASLAETARHHRETEAAARAREARQRAKDAKGAKGGSSDRADYFDEKRTEAFKRAREYKNPKSKLTDPILRAQARKRLMAEFGQALLGRGYKPSVVRTMIERALDAAGY